MVAYKTQEEWVKAYFLQHQNQDIAHPEVVDWVTTMYQKTTGKVFRDPDRAIRKLYSHGFLQKVRKGVYRYDPSAETHRMLEDFNAKQKQAILERDGYLCVVCGQGKANGIELHVDHIKPKSLGGSATLENGQTLCAQHNFLKKNLQQTETGKKMFIRLYALAKQNNEPDLMSFCADILQTYEKHAMNGHVVWKV